MGKKSKKREQEQLQSVDQGAEPSRYVPPGYDIINQEKNVFSRRELHGKELWLIRAPINTPISSFHAIPMSLLDEGHTEIVCSNKTYSLVEDCEKDGDCSGLVVASEKTAGKFKLSKGAAFTRRIHIHENFPLPVKDIPEDLRSTPLPVMQPENLRIRYGFGEGDQGSKGEPQHKKIKSNGHPDISNANKKKKKLKMKKSKG